MTHARPAGESTQLPAEISAASTAPEEAKVTLYVWDLPVRITHWVNVASILVLSVTGYYIANPFIQTQGIATDEFLMGTVRFVHFTTAFIFTVSVLFRVYWAVASRARYARWDQFLPLRAPRQRALLRMVGYYTFLRKEPPPEIGHNPLAGVTYMGLYGLFALQILTGFALYSIPFHGGIWPTLFGWIITIFGTQPVRLVHTLVMFLIIAFTIHHVYSAILIDIEERSGLVSSIVTGSKSLSRQHIAEALEEDEPKRRQTRNERGRE
jgi:Ni/Fe-hydrogenase 1 B-type cytochrome subunit